MSDAQICISICAETADELFREIDAAKECGDMLEIRFDCLKPDKIKDQLIAIRRQADSLSCIFTYRPKTEGGKKSLSIEQRLEFWNSILPIDSNENFLIDLESDIFSHLDIQSNKTVLSSHSFGDASVETIYRSLREKTDGFIKIAISIKEPAEAVPIWKLMDKSLIPIAMGEAGKWTRILALAYGSPITYASIEKGKETADGQISARELKEVYRVKELTRQTDVYGLIAGDTSYSLSPFIQNAVIKFHDLDAVYIPFQMTDLEAFMRRMVNPKSREIELNFKGFAVTNPHKISVIHFLDSIDDTARQIGAVNTIKIESGKLFGFNTDAIGFIAPLKNNFGGLKDARIAVLGSGGAARSCIHALKNEGSEIVVFTREPAAVKDLPEIEMRRHLSAPIGFSDFDIIVNATPLGTVGKFENETPATQEQLAGVKLAYDLVYNPTETRFLLEAKNAGAVTLSGVEMLIEQAAAQFEIWTGQKTPINILKAASNFLS